MTQFHPFRGLDLRPGQSDASGFLSEARNVIIDGVGRALRRPALRFRGLLDPTSGRSAGLYAVGDQLRQSVVLSPMTTLGNPMMPTLSCDYLLGNDSAGLEVLGATADATGRSTVLVRHGNGSNQLHRAPDSGFAPPGATALTPGFTPSVSLIRSVGRVWTMDQNNRYLRYSTIDDASGADPDFTTGRDLSRGSGFLDVSLYSPGSGTPQALSTQGNRVVVFYRGALLIYAVDFDQLRNYLDSAIVGPGTNAPRSIAEIGGDLVFLSDTGVRSLSDVQKALDQTEDSVFGRVDPLARDLADNALVTPIGHYARRLGAYLLAFGNELLVLPFVAGSQVLGWTRWTLPSWAVVVGFADSQGQTFLRIKHPDGRSGLFSFDDLLNDDENFDGGSHAIPALIEPVPIRSTSEFKIDFVSASGTEPLQVQVVANGLPVLAPDGAVQGRPIVLPPRAPVPSRAAIGRRGYTASARIYDAASRAGWRVDGLWIDINKKG